jgi:hypothetical protein
VEAQEQLCLIATVPRVYQPMFYRETSNLGAYGFDVEQFKRSFPLKAFRIG